MVLLFYLEKMQELCNISTLNWLVLSFFPNQNAD